MEKKFAAYKTVDAFILDEDFQEWVCCPSREKDEFWQEFFKKYPGQKELADEARAFLLAVEFPSDLPEAEKGRIWSGIETQTHRSGKRISEHEIAGDTKIRGIRYWIRAAAAVLLLMAASFAIYNVFFNKITYRTGYGEITTVILPDSSAVTLNSNSELVFKKGFTGKSVREAWLKGEAFFKVRRVSSESEEIKFIVHTADLDVSVLGTAFNVYERKDGTEVVLQSGKVELDLHDTHLMMQPGELVRYKKDVSGYIQRKTETTKRLSWVNGTLLMHDTPFQTVVKILQENYGEDVWLSDSTILEEKITGELPLTDKDVFLEALSTTIQLKITKDMERNRLVIERK